MPTAAFDGIKDFENTFYFEVVWLCKAISVFTPHDFNLRSVTAVMFVYSIIGISLPAVDTFGPYVQRYLIYLLK